MGGLWAVDHVCSGNFNVQPTFIRAVHDSNGLLESWHARCDHFDEKTSFRDQSDLGKIWTYILWLDDFELVWLIAQWCYFESFPTNVCIFPPILFTIYPIKVNKHAHENNSFEVVVGTHRLSEIHDHAISIVGIWNKFFFPANSPLSENSNTVQIEFKWSFSKGFLSYHSIK